jgi:hypothetical protein
MIAKTNKIKVLPQDELLLYLMSSYMLDKLDNIDAKANSLTKSIRGINRFAERTADVLEGVSSEAHQRIVHNFNVIMNAIDKDTLEIPIGELKVEK